MKVINNDNACSNDSIPLVYEDAEATATITYSELIKSNSPLRLYLCSYLYSCCFLGKFSNNIAGA